MDDGRPNLLDVVCFAPLGLAQLASEELPKLARQRRQAVENRIQLARWIGQIAVQQADRELRKRWRAAHDRPAATPPATPIDDVVGVGWPADAPPLVEEQGAASIVEPTGAALGGDVVVAGHDVPPAADGIGTVTSVAVPAADELPIAGYESLAAQQVVHRLATLTVDERAAIRRFETAHRGRRTILAKLDQLQAG